jgi:AcrR family transcriptional regulator
VPDQVDHLREASRSRGGRRERNMDDKRRRIFEAAATLFAERGFDGVSTQQIADRADVAAGTVFRYASSKNELVIMVYNQEMRAAVDHGERASAGAVDGVEAIVALVRPVLVTSLRSPFMMVAYQRELLFGPATGVHRAAGLALVAELERAIAARLIESARAAGIDDGVLAQEAQWAARTVFATLALLLAEPSTGAHPDADPIDELRGRAAQIVRGFLATVQQKSEEQRK